MMPLYLLKGIFICRSRAAARRNVPGCKHDSTHIMQHCCQKRLLDPGVWKLFVERDRSHHRRGFQAMLPKSFQSDLVMEFRSAALEQAMSQHQGGNCIQP